jgi:excisionase family DNA binding protein
VKSQPDNPQQNSRLLRTSEAARYLSVGTKRIRQLIVCGKLQCVQLLPGGNSPFLLDVRDLDKFIEAQKLESKRVRE